MRLTNILLIVVVCLLALVLFDRMREPEQMGALKDSLDANRATYEQLLAQSRSLTREQREAEVTTRELIAALRAHRAGLEQGLRIRLAEGSSVDLREPAADEPPRANATEATARDGIPREGVNFLLPLDRSDVDPERVGGTLRTVGTDVPGTNPLTISYGGTRDIHRTVSDQLVRINYVHPDRYEARLASRCIISDDYKTFTFTIREGVLWQVPPCAREDDFSWLRERVLLSADDFVFAFDMIMDPQVECEHLKAYYEKLIAWEAPDSQTLVLRWSESQYSNIESSLLVQPLPRHVYSRAQDGTPLPKDQVAVIFNKHWFDELRQVIGVGAYQLESYEPKVGFQFRRNPEFYAAPGHFMELFWDCGVPQREAQLVAFKNNQLHSGLLSPSQFKAEVLDQHEPRFAAADPADPKAGRAGAFGWELVEQNRWVGLAWNTRQLQLREVAVRRALAHAYPFARIHEQVHFGLSARCLGPIHPSHPMAAQDMEPFAYDLERARMLLDEADWTDTDGDGWRDKQIDDKQVRLRLGVTYYAENRPVANELSLYADELAQVGIELVPDPVDSMEWSRRIDDRAYDGFAILWGTSESIDVDFHQLWHASDADEPKSSNLAMWAHVEASALMDEFRAAFDPIERTRLARQIQRIIYEEQPYLFMSTVTIPFIWQNARTSPEDQREILGGVTQAFDEFHPLFNRRSSRWYFEH